MQALAAWEANAPLRWKQYTMRIDDEPLAPRAVTVCWQPFTEWGA